MAMMSNLFLLCCLLLSVRYSVSEVEPAPVPAPVLSPEEYATPPQPFALPGPAPDSESPESAPADSPLLSPPAPAPSDLKSTTPSPASSPAPSPTASNVNHSDISANEGDDSSGVGDGGMSGGKKAGIAVGVIAAACLVGFGGAVYKKRQDNVRRSQYGYAVRRELL